MKIVGVDKGKNTKSKSRNLHTCEITTGSTIIISTCVLTVHCSDVVNIEINSDVHFKL